MHDLQSIFRVYRLGQKKKVFIYRFLAQGTMEEKIYNRQVTKQSLSLRVIDEHQLDRHFKKEELRELYKFNPDLYDSNEPNLLDIKAPPPDPLLISLLESCSKWISNYIEHDSLLENRLDEGLSEQEREIAWEEYKKEQENEKMRSQLQLDSAHNSLLMNQNTFYNNCLNNIQMHNNSNHVQKSFGPPTTNQEVSKHQYISKFNQFILQRQSSKFNDNGTQHNERLFQNSSYSSNQTIMGSNTAIRPSYDSLRLQYIQKQLATKKLQEQTNTRNT